MHGYATDHAVLTATVNLKPAGIELPTEYKPQQTATAKPTVRIVTPVSQANTHAFQTRVLEAHSHSIQQLGQRLGDIIDTDIMQYMDQQKATDAAATRRLEVLEGRPAREVVEDIAQQVVALLEDCAHNIAPQTCATRITNPTGVHYRPKAVGKRRRRCMSVRKRARQLAAEVRAQPAGDHQAMPQVQEFIASHHGNPQPTQGTAQKPASPQDTVLQQLKEIEQAVAKDIKAIDQEHHRTDMQQAVQALQQMLDDRPKVGHKMVFKSKQPPQRLMAVRDRTTGKATTQPAKIIHAVEHHFEELLQPPRGQKTGQYLPTEATRQYPWQQAGAPDPFHLATDATTSAAGPRRWLLQHMRDELMFFDCCKQLSNGKAPGPDQVPNEIIKMLPADVKKHIHKLFIVMWATGITPHSWKASTTCLLHKKGDAMEIGNYRPIGLANTLYKLWTRVVTYVMYEYAEQHRVLSSVQGGFRKNTGTNKQLQMLVMAIEDAKLSAQDLYKLQVDFSSAFNMSDHDLTLQILYDLGFPTDAIEVVKDIYTGATTRYTTPYGCTKAIQIDRGTLQGDTLSPFLFLIYIEPLLRWLNVGSRGYKFGCVPSREQVRTACNSLAYADDLEILTSKLSDLKIQATKLSLYSDWAQMKVNVGKTITTGILYGSARTGQLGHSNPIDDKILLRQLQGQVMVQGAPVQYQHPAQPFTYLGVELTLTLDWTHQTNKVLSKLRDQAAALYHTKASTSQQLRMIQTVIKPGIVHSYCVAPYRPSDIKMIDAGTVA